MTRSLDVAVVGAGPAGLACALAAARLGLTTALFDPQEPGADAPCGEGILPSGVRALSSLGLSDLADEGRPFDRIRYVPRHGSMVELRMPESGLALPRPRLGRGLESAARRSGVDRIVRRVRTREARGSFSIEASGEDWSARTLVACDGARGKSAAWLRGVSPPARDVPRPRSERFGLRARFRARRGLEAVEVHLGGPCEVYLTPLPGGEVNVACLASKRPLGVVGAEALLGWALEQHPRAREECGALTTAPALRSLARARPTRLAAAGAFLCGDAGGGVDPVLGCGVAIALTTGVLAARSALRVVRGETDGRPEREYEALHRREVRGGRVLAGALLALGARPRLLRGAAFVARAFPAGTRPLVGIALGH